MTKKADDKAEKTDEKAESKTNKPSGENAGQEFSLKIVIDRVEDDVATLVVYDDDAVKFNLPAKYLPDGTNGGDHYQLSFKKDEQSRKQMKQEVDNLLSDLLGQK